MQYNTIQNNAMQYKKYLLHINKCKQLQDS